RSKRDFIPEVDAILPEAETLAKSGKLQSALDKLEKQTRNVSVVQHCYDARDNDLLNSNVLILSKKYGQLKAAVQAIAESAMEDVKKTAGVEKWLELVQTLRTVTDGKVRPSNPSTYKESMQTACDLLSDLQVETYSSVERREKTEFILEQTRLLIVVAQLKAAELDKNGKEVLGGGETEWVKETPSIKEDDDQEKAALEHIVYYIVLASHSNERSHMLHLFFADPALVKLELHFNLLKCFTTRELIRWPGIETIYGGFLRKTPVFSSENQWEDFTLAPSSPTILRMHNPPGPPRLTSLLDLSQKRTEETITRLVVVGTIWARIDRPAGIVNFRNQRSPEDVMSSDMEKLLGVVEKTWMGMNAAQAAQSRVKL
ncbi:PCI-domain-containing protein, partial [Mycena galericulata]